MYKLMLLDDEENILKSLMRILRKNEEWDIETYTSPQEALKRAQCCIFDVVISDYHMPQMNGIEFLSELMEMQPDAMRILLTGCVEIDILLEALNKVHAFRFIPKPWNDETLLETIKEAITYRNLIHENRMLATQLREQQAELAQLKQMNKSNISYQSNDDIFRKSIIER